MRVLPPVVIAGLAASIALSGCGAVQSTPRKAINDQLNQSIRKAGGDPSAWKIDNDCVLNGSCTATLSRAGNPGRVIATNSYIARDSRAFLKGENRIVLAATGKR